MQKKSRLLFAIGALLLALAFFFPLWQITLDAPQYPEGIGLLIWSDKITGMKPFDLQNINGLNHYIGMKEIVPDSIPELRFMPWILGGLSLLGFAGAAVGRRRLLQLWLALLIVLGAAGMVDFYMWNYDYGHNLDLENASIKIPGMSYQPPLIGTKKLLNFTASSWPAMGGVLIFIAVGIGFLALRLDRASISRSGIRASTHAMPLLVILVLFGLNACAPEPRAVRLGEDGCAHCRMTIVDARFAAELVTSKGRVYVFDAVECLAAWQLEKRVAGDDLHALLLTDHANPSTWIPADQAVILRSAATPSPMAMNFSAHMDSAQASRAAAGKPGELLSWQQVLDAVEAKWQRSTPGASHAQNMRAPK